MRRGFTLVETLVALILLEIGMLALLSTSAVATRELAIAHRAVRAQLLAHNRLELLRASACAAPSSGRAAAEGFTETWIVAATETRREISVTVQYASSAGRSRVVTLEGATMCS